MGSRRLLILVGLFATIYAQEDNANVQTRSVGVTEDGVRKVEAVGGNRSETNAVVNKTYSGVVSSSDDVHIYKFESVHINTLESVQIEVSVQNQSDWTDSSVDPLFTVVRTSQNIMSMQVPVAIGNRVYTSISRILCTAPGVSQDLKTFFVDVSTLASYAYNYSLSTRIVSSQKLQDEKEFDLKVTPSQPQVLSYQMTESTVLVKFQSSDEHCSIVSVQNAVCPVYDQPDDVTYEGVHQQFTEKAGITVRKTRLVSDWFFIVVIVVPSNESCLNSDSLFPTDKHSYFSQNQQPPSYPYMVLPAAAPSSDPSVRKTADFVPLVPIRRSSQSKTVHISIHVLDTHRTYLEAMGATVLFFSCFYCFFFLYALAEYCKRRKAVRECVVIQHTAENGHNTVTDNPLTSSQTARSEYSDVNLASGSQAALQGDPQTVSQSYQTAQYLSQQNEHNHEFSLDDNSSCSTSSVLGSTRTLDAQTEDNTYTAAAHLAHQHLIQRQSAVYLTDLAKKRPTTLHRKYRMYVWTLCTVAIFYALPVTYLMISYQLFFDMGNQDFCYYNFWCSKPFLMFASFNSLFSNIGYVMLGFLFFLIVYTKHLNYRLRLQVDPHLHDRGIPKHFGLFYAIALALVMEGVMSGCYHLCPNGFNFQFDVSFMYIIGGLGTLRMYQSRHPDVNANSHAVFLGFALVIAITVVGVILRARQWFWIVFVVVYLLTVLYVTCQVYLIGKVKIDSKLPIRFKNYIKREYLVKRPFRHYLPAKPDRFFLLLIGNIVNWTIGIFGLVNQPNSFGSFLVSIFIINLLLYFMFYIIMKLRCKEKVKYSTVFLMVVSMCTWLSALYFFEDVSTNWQYSPAKSRELNKSCVLLDFYDNHDIWHFLSAISLFISFLIVLILDDDLDNTERHKIKVF